MPPAYKPAAVKEDGSLDMAQVQRDWMKVIERHEKKRMTWVQRSEKFLKVYADADAAPKQNAKRRYCVTWMNTQTRMPAVYAREPKCVVSRRYQTPNQDVRDAVVALERVTNVMIGDSKLHAAIMSARLDRLIPGRGTLWIRYEGKDDGSQITEQKIYTEFVGFKDFGHGEGRTWEEIDCQWRRTYYTEDKLKERFGDDVMTRCTVTLDHAQKDAPDDERQATVYECWVKSRNAVYWLARTAKEALEVGEPPLKLKNFFPAPKPLFGTVTNENCIPTPDPTYYQDQENEINTLTRRIDSLTASLKLVGFYPAGPSQEGRAEIERALQPGFENKMIPVASWAAFAEKGGVSAIVWLPVKDIAFIIESCVRLRQQLLSDVDRITGVNDIMQGETDPNETLGAQQLKSQYGSQRMRDTKDDFVRFSKEACEIIAEVAAENFSDETLGRLAAMPHVAMQPPMDPQTGQLVEGAQPEPVINPETGMPEPAGWIKLLRNQLAREVLVDVETDSTIHPDEDAEKQRRVEMFDAVNKGFAPLAQMSELDPQLAAALVPVWGDTMLFMIRGFRAGRELEQTIEEAVNNIKAASAQQAKGAQNQPPPQDPAIVKATLDAKTTAEKQQGDAKQKAFEEANAHTQRMKELDNERYEAEMADARERDFHAAKMDNARVEHDAQLGFQRERADGEMSLKREGLQAKQAPAVGVQLGPDTEKAIAQAQATSADAMAEAARGMTQAAQAMTQTAETVGAMAAAAVAPRRLVKDPKTGERRSEVMLN